MKKELKHIAVLLRAILKVLLETSGKSEAEVIKTLSDTDRPDKPPVNG